METRAGNVLENTHGCSRDSVRVLMAYDGSGRRVSKTRMRKERDDETELNYFGARYLDPMLGLWISVDPARQFSSPYLYAGNGYNPIVSVDEDGNDLQSDLALSCQQNAMETTAKGAAFYVTGILTGMEVVGLVGSVGTVLESILKL